MLRPHSVQLTSVMRKQERRFKRAFGLQVSDLRVKRRLNCSVSITNWIDFCKCHCYCSPVVAGEAIMSSTARRMFRLSLKLIYQSVRQQNKYGNWSKKNTMTSDPKWCWIHFFLYNKHYDMRDNDEKRLSSIGVLFN